MKKTCVLAILSCSLFVTTASIGCSDDKNNEPEIEKTNSEPEPEPKPNKGITLDFKDSSKDLNNFYRNQITSPITGDPFILYEESEKIFYLYGTTRKNHLNNDIYDNFEIYSSRDLKSWEKVSDAFDEDVRQNSWMKPDLHGDARFWAPEVHKFGNYYYMYFTAAGRGGRLRNSIAWAKSPQGPFYTDFTNEFAAEIAALDPGNGARYNGQTYIFETDNAALPNDNDWVAIDGTIFRDHNGKFYYYLVRDQHVHPDGEHKSTIWGCEMLNPFIRNANRKFVQITDVARSVVGGEKDQKWEVQSGAWNEGPYMVKHNNKYYMSYSANHFETKYYSIGHAVSDNPLTGFVKPKENAMIMGLGDGTGADWDYFSGTGHHMFLNIGNQKYAVYHKHRENDKLRVVAIDSYDFREDGSLFINGPTKTYQPLPEVISGYRNVAKEATITLENNTDGHLKFLTDNAVGLQKFTSKYEVGFDKGKTVIMLTFPKKTLVHGIILYTSALFNQKLMKIDKIEFGDSRYIENIVNTFDTSYMFAGSNMNAILEEDIEVESIKIEIDSKYEFRLSEIYVLGK